MSKSTPPNTASDWATSRKKFIADYAVKVGKTPAMVEAEYEVARCYCNQFACKNWLIYPKKK